MKEITKNLLEDFINTNPKLVPLVEDLKKSVNIIIESCKNNGTVLTCGNGGSAADSEHIVGELMKGFLLKRPLEKSQFDKIYAVSECEDPQTFGENLQQGIKAISLVSQVGLITAFLNDVDPDMIFAQQVFAYGGQGDVLIALSTSGNSKNVVNAAISAKAKGMKIISFTGERESKLSKISDVTFRVPSLETYKIQEYHLPIYHMVCGMVETEIFG